MRWLDWVGVCLVVSLVVTASVLVFAFQTLNLAQIRMFEGAGALIALALWAGSGILLVIGVGDLRHARGLPERMVARRDLFADCYRFVAKGALAAVMVLLYEARQRNLMAFLRSHPLLFFMLALLALSVLAVNEWIEPFWRRLFRETFSGTVRDDESDPQPQDREVP